ncbi:MAG: hypothetical protein HZA35_01255 [Parcubacteria group bacterium]|nr:hypothetical protein [Parcubacteria group bacterium]
MKYIGAGIVWLGYAGAVTAVAFGTHDATATMWMGIIGAFFALHASVDIARS